jgi:hypothetical protein
MTAYLPTRERQASPAHDYADIANMGDPSTSADVVHVGITGTSE